MQAPQQIEADAPNPLPKEMGSLTHENIETEVADRTRLRNHWQVGSYAGLGGGVSASGQTAADMNITKAGNRRLRTELVELSWRLLLFQPRYYLGQKWKHVLLNSKAHARARKTRQRRFRPPTVGRLVALEDRPQNAQATGLSDDRGLNGTNRFP